MTMSDHEKSAELEGKEAERAAIDLIRKEQALRIGTVFDSMLLTYLNVGDTPAFREQLRAITINYLIEVDQHPHVMKAAVPDWVIRLLEKPMQILSVSGVSADDLARSIQGWDFSAGKVENAAGIAKAAEWIDAHNTNDEPDASTDESEDAE